MLEKIHKKNEITNEVFLEYVHWQPPYSFYDAQLLATIKDNESRFSPPVLASTSQRSNNDNVRDDDSSDDSCSSSSCESDSDDDNDDHNGRPPSLALPLALTAAPTQKEEVGDRSVVCSPSPPAAQRGQIIAHKRIRPFEDSDDSDCGGDDRKDETGKGEVTSTVNTPSQIIAKKDAEPGK